MKQTVQIRKTILFYVMATGFPANQVEDLQSRADRLFGKGVAKVAFSRSGTDLDGKHVTICSISESNDKYLPADAPIMFHDHMNPTETIISSDEAALIGHYNEWKAHLRFRAMRTDETNEALDALMDMAYINGRSSAARKQFIRAMALPTGKGVCLDLQAVTSHAYARIGDIRKCFGQELNQLMAMQNAIAGKMTHTA